MIRRDRGAPRVTAGRRGQTTTSPFRRAYRVDASQVSSVTQGCDDGPKTGPARLLLFQAAAWLWRRKDGGVCRSTPWRRGTTGCTCDDAALRPSPVFTASCAEASRKSTILSRMALQRDRGADRRTPRRASERRGGEHPPWHAPDTCRQRSVQERANRFSRTVPKRLQYD